VLPTVFQVQGAHRIPIRPSVGRDVTISLSRSGAADHEVIRRVMLRATDFRFAVADCAHPHYDAVMLRELMERRTTMVTSEPGAGYLSNPLERLGPEIQERVAAHGRNFSSDAAGLSAAVDIIHREIQAMARDSRRVQEAFRDCALQPGCERRPIDAGLVGGDTPRPEPVILTTWEKLQELGLWAAPGAQDAGAPTQAPHDRGERRRMRWQATREASGAVGAPLG
jgi:hypothetical protein